MKSRFSLILMLALTACTSHFITDKDYRTVVADDFQSRSSIMQAAGIDLASMAEEKSIVCIVSVQLLVSYLREGIFQP